MKVNGIFIHNRSTFLESFIIMYRLFNLHYDIVDAKIVENRCKQTLARVYFVNGRADSLSFQLY